MLLTRRMGGTEQGKYSLFDYDYMILKTCELDKTGESNVAKRKTIPKPKKTIAMLQESRNGGQLALRGYSYQFLYSCYLLISAMNEVLSHIFN